MNKKIFGIRIGTVLSVVLSFVAAVVFWLFVKYSEYKEETLTTALSFLIKNFI